MAERGNIFHGDDDGDGWIQGIYHFAKAIYIPSVILCFSNYMSFLYAHMYSYCGGNVWFKSLIVFFLYFPLHCIITVGCHQIQGCRGQQFIHLCPRWPLWSSAGFHTLPRRQWFHCGHWCGSLGILGILPYSPFRRHSQHQCYNQSSPSVPEAL